MKTCTACQEPIDDRAKRCPHCTTEQVSTVEQVFRTILAIAFGLALVVGAFIVWGSIAH